MEVPVDVELATVLAEGDRAVVAVRGDLDIYTSPRLLDHFEGLIRAGHRHLVVDLEGVDFIDSSGLGALVGVLKRARVSDGSVHIVSTHKHIIKLFRMTMLPRDFPTYDSVAEAIAAIPAAGLR